jgi:hypothetical protein
MGLRELGLLEKSQPASKTLKAHPPTQNRPLQAGANPNQARPMIEAVTINSCSSARATVPEMA